MVWLMREDRLGEGWCSGRRDGASVMSDMSMLWLFSSSSSCPFTSCSRRRGSS